MEPTGVSPEPETRKRPSPARIDGAVASPTKCAARPICMKRIAAISRHEARTPLSREEPAAPLVPETPDDALEAAGVDALQDLRYFPSDGQPRPGLRSRSLIHVATPRDAPRR